MNARPFYAGVGPGGVTDFVNSGIIQNVKKGKTVVHNVVRVLCSNLRYCGGAVSDKIVRDSGGGIGFYQRIYRGRTPF